MIDHPLVSIITPCFNGESYLDRYFASILGQTYAPLELIFINDGSADDTAQIAQSYRAALEEKGIRYTYLEQENAGQAAALNRGLKLFTGEYLTWPDADDEMTPDCIEKKVAYLQAHPELDMCICKILQIDEENPLGNAGILERIFPQDEDNLFEDLIYLKNVFYAPGGYMVRASAVDETIPNREIYPGRGGQNVQMLLPIAYRGRYGYMDEFLYKYYIRTSSHSHSIDTAEKTIRQYGQFEALLLHTLKRMSAEVYTQYEIKIRKRYSRVRFGLALDTQNPKLISRYYMELTQVSDAGLMDWLRCLKYTNPLICRLFGKKSGE